MSQNKVKILDRTSSDNQYLHKDFHGALCYAIKYLDDTFGPDATKEYLKQVGRENFSPLIEKLKINGLAALEQHYRDIFELEGGHAQFKREDGRMTIIVSNCPSVAHLREHGQLCTTRYCETTVCINEAICDAAGYQCSCTYQPGKGKCQQTFWKKEAQK